VRRSPLALWHLLSLDAPTVAALWTWFVARCCGIALPFASIAAMFLAVWILYASDRLLDARGNTAGLEERHHFHHRHRRMFIPFVAIAAVGLAALTPGLSSAALRIYALLAALLAGWFLVIHTRLAHERRLPKELAVGLFFSAAVFIPTVARRPELRLSLLAPAFVFAAVCALNCMCLYRWEHPRDRTNANWTTRIATHHLTLAAAIILVAAFAGIAPLVLPNLASKLLVPVAPSTWPIAAACVLSTLLLVALNRGRAKISPLNLRAAADLALLTPILFLGLQ